MNARVLTACAAAAVATAFFPQGLFAQGDAKQAPPIEAMGKAAASTAPRTIAAPANCSVAAVSKLVSGKVSVTGVKAEQTPAGAVYCAVSGELVTEGEGAAPGKAGFVFNLPVKWNGKFLFNGGAGLDGAVPATMPSQIDAGYVTAGTDSGHVADPQYPHPGVDPTWSRTASGERDMPKLIDYAYRSRHQVAAVGKRLVNAYYGQAIGKSYFMGCSSGGREALIEAQRYPDSYDGFIAGNPLVDMNNTLWSARNVRALLQSPIPYKQLAAIDAEVMRQCDGLDGVKDGLIQNPAKCRFDPAPLVRSGALSKAQADAVATYLSPVLDSSGKVLSLGSSPSGMGDTSMPIPGSGTGLAGLTVSMSDPSPAPGRPFPWGKPTMGPTNWLLVHAFLAWVALDDRNADVLGPDVFAADGRVRTDVAASLHRYDSMVVDPTAMGRFFASGRKLLIYHGYSDAILNPYQTEAVYRMIAARAGGYAKAGASARLFMAPDMQHCFGGSGPNAFDPLQTMVDWVEKGQAPDSMIAAKFEGNDPTKPITRAMPLCPYPAMARYSGRGDFNKPENWSCPAGDTRLLR